MPFPLTDEQRQKAGPQNETEIVVAAGLQELADMIEREMGWDAPHSLWIMYRRLAEATPIGNIYAVEFKRLHAFTPAQQKYPPGMTIRMLAEEMGKVSPQQREEIVPPDLLGWALASEAWMAFSTPDDPELTRDAENRRINERPDRVEVRTIMAVDKAERLYTFMRIRSDGDSITRVFGADEDGGAIPEALIELIRVT